MADYRILQVDFRETLAACEGKAALIATSPPYPDARTCYESLTWEDYQDLGDAVKDALLPGGHCLLNLSAMVRQLRRGHGTERDPLPFRVFLDWYDRVGLTAPDTIVAGRRAPPGAFQGRFRRDWEPLFWFRKPGDARPIHRERLREKRRRWKCTRTIRDEDGVLQDRGRHEGSTADRGNLWDYGAVGNGLGGDADLEAQNHPARWPYRLAADIVACFSDVGDLVCDPFLGGGTTLAAACDGDRRFLGGDLAEEWAEKSQALADRRYAQLKLVGARS